MCVCVAKPVAVELRCHATALIIIWMSPLSFLGATGIIFHFSMKIMLQANRIAPYGTPRFAASHLGLFCLPMSHKKDARLIYGFIL